MLTNFDRLATRCKTPLKNFKLIFCYNAITVVVGWTIATAKVQRNYNCYNVYFSGCLHLSSTDVPKTCKAMLCNNQFWSLIHHHFLTLYNIDALRQSVQCCSIS